MESPMMAPQGQGPLGGTSSILAGTHPVAPTRNKGRANILAKVAPKRNQESRKTIASVCFNARL